MRLDEVYKNSGLGKWFHKQSATKEPGWDRYNTAGKRVGKCGDAKEGEPYSACLSKQKAKKLGKEGIGNFVSRKRKAQKQAGRGKKGTGEKGKTPIFVETGAAKQKVNEAMENLKENCGCEHSESSSVMSKIKNKMKKKMIKEGKLTETPDVPNTPITNIKEYMDFSELDLSEFRGKKTIIETANGQWYGTLGIYKNNFAIFQDQNVKKVIEPMEITRLISENTKIVILEKNTPNDPEKWSSCKSQAKSKFDVYPSAYANAWAAKCYKKKGGSWRTVKEDTNHELEMLNEVIKHKDGKWVVMNKAQTKVLGTHPSKGKALAQLRAIEASKARHGMHEGVDMLLKDKIKGLFFNKVNEEVVNKDHKGSMTPAEIEKRDRIAEKLKKRGNIKRIKTEKRLDSQEEAEYRTATFQVLAMRHGKKGKKAKKSDK